MAYMLHCNMDAVKIYLCFKRFSSHQLNMLPGACRFSFVIYLSLFVVSGYSLCLGKSYLFRFNHPEEASRMKNMLPQKSPVSALAYNTGMHTTGWRRRKGKSLS